MNEWSFRFGGIVQCEAANWRVQAKCGVCKTLLLYLDNAVGLLSFNFAMAVLRMWIGACFFVRARRLSVSEYTFLRCWGMMNFEAWWMKACGGKFSNHLNPCVCVLELIYVIRTRVCPRALTQGDSCDERGIIKIAKMMYFSDGIVQCNYREPTFSTFYLCRVPFRSWSQGQFCMGFV